MSGNKYADLPDIDTAPDIYETDDIFPTVQPTKAESSDDEAGPSKLVNKKQLPPPTKEELDMTGLMNPEEAAKKFRKAERRHRSRTAYVYPSSPDIPLARDHSGVPRPVTLSQRLRLLNAELTSLETELSDPTNPLLHKEREEDNVDPGELIKDLVVVRSRLDKIRKGHEGRARLMGSFLDKEMKESESGSGEDPSSEDENSKSSDVFKMQNLIEIDKRVGELEKYIGSSNAPLDETSPLPPPLLPLIMRLNSQLALLTQPRHIDSISRRLKLLLSDLDRASAAQQLRHHSTQQMNSLITPIPENLLPILSRLGPALPQIPHVLARLRTLSTLHTSAAEFHATLEDLEKEHRRVHGTLVEIDDAIATVEQSLEENRGIVKNNIAGLEGRVDSLLQRLEDLGRDCPQ